MKKLVNWLLGIVIVVLVITWGVVGIHIANGDYEAVTPGAYIALVCLIVGLVCGLYKRFSDKCPHCGRLNQGFGEYCAYCGKKKN